MNIKSFLRLVELPTKVASVLPLLMGTLYALYRFEHFSLLLFGMMLVSLLSFDMATTAINNYYDYKKALKTEGYGYETHNPIVAYRLSERTVLTVIFVLLALAAGCGIGLVVQTGWITFLLGGLSFLIGILYSFGPLPISRMPLGELFSGLFMGFIIIFISVFIHAGDALAMLSIEGGRVGLSFRLSEVLYLFAFSIPAILGIAGIMLANNLCDVDDDLENRRYTLPVYIGRKNALALFRAGYYLSFTDVPVLMLLGVPPLLALVPFVIWVPLSRNISAFMEKQEKASTFILSVRSFMLMASVRIAVLSAALLLRSIIG